MTTDQIESRESPPLWLPSGSVRAILAIMAMIITGAMLLIGVNVPEWWVASGSVIWAFYFKRA